MPTEAEPIVAARARGVPVVSEIELGVRLLPNPFVAVTGTNGKTTTTALLGAILEAASVQAEVAGNIGRALTSLVGHVSPEVWIVCELSSFQLEDVTTLAPRVAVLTNLEPDHLDRHGTFVAYEAIKLSMFERQGADDVAVVPRASGRFRAMLGASSSRPTTRCRRSRASAVSTTGRTRPPRPPQRARSACPTQQSRQRSARSPVSSTASRRSRPSTACST